MTIQARIKFSLRKLRNIHVWHIIYAMDTIAKTQICKPLRFLSLCLILASFSLFGEESTPLIQSLEQAGDYATALQLAREGTNLPDCVVSRLEHEVLSLGASRLLFDENLAPRVKLLQLLELVGMEPLNPSEKPIVQINDWAQKNLLRQGERWDKQSEKYESMKEQLKPLLTDLGFINGSSAHFSRYQGALVHGALLSRVRMRLNFLVEQWQSGVRFSHVYLLSGARPLEPEIETKEALTHADDSPLKIRKDWIAPDELPKTESEMMEWVWNQSELPAGMRESVKMVVVDAPIKVDPATGKQIRPNTIDTVEYWLHQTPPCGRYLAVTNAPYTNRQDLVIRALSPKEYGFDTIGSTAPETERMSIVLDELARFIYSTKQIPEQ